MENLIYELEKKIKNEIDNREKDIENVINISLEKQKEISRMLEKINK